MRPTREGRILWKTEDVVGSQNARQSSSSTPTDDIPEEPLQGPPSLFSLRHIARAILSNPCERWRPESAKCGPTTSTLSSSPCARRSTRTRWCPCSFHPLLLSSLKPVLILTLVLCVGSLSLSLGCVLVELWLKEDGLEGGGPPELAQMGLTHFLSSLSLVAGHRVPWSRSTPDRSLVRPPPLL